MKWKGPEGGLSCCFSRQVVSNSFATLRTVTHQAPLSMEFPRQEYWSELPFPSVGDLPDPGIEPVSPTLQADSLPLSHQGSPPQGCYTSLNLKWQPVP